MRRAQRAFVGEESPRGSKVGCRTCLIYCWRNPWISDQILCGAKCSGSIILNCRLKVLSSRMNELAANVAELEREIDSIIDINRNKNS